MSDIKFGIISRSKEDYLRVMLDLEKHDASIHSIDIANALGVSRASVSRMMDVLKDSGYTAKERYGTVSLTEKGRKAASYIRKRHDLLESFLVDVLGVDAKTANSDACRMEHTISHETTEKLDTHLRKLSDCAKTALYGEQNL